MSDRYNSPSSFENAMQNLTFTLATLHGRAGRTSATIVQASTLASCIISANGLISSFRMKALDSGTTSSTTFNTVGLFKIASGTNTAVSLATLRTNKGSNGATAVSIPSGATQLVGPGDILLIKRLTKQNTASQLFVSAEVNKVVS